MLRQIIQINEEKCTGCGLCARACHEGAIGIVNGKAKLLREDYCDGMGDCLPNCPEHAISFEMREAPAYDAAAVQANKTVRNMPNWPVQIKLAPLQSASFQGKSLLIAADCSAYVYAGFYRDFIQNRTVLIGCPKLDQTDYSWKLGEILRNNNITDVTVVRMTVPCCTELESAVKKAIETSGKTVPLYVSVISREGMISNLQEVRSI